MRIIEKMVARFLKQEKQIVTTHTLGKHILENKSGYTPIYTESRSFEAKRIKTPNFTIKF